MKLPDGYLCFLKAKRNSAAGSIKIQQRKTPLALRPPDSWRSAFTSSLEKIDVAFVVI